MNLGKLQAELTRDEGEKFKLYRCTAGYLTIGIGHNIEEKGISPAVSRLMFAEDIAEVEADLDRALPWWRKLDDGRQRALANMCFNLGLSRLLGFKNMLAALQTGDYARAVAEAKNSKWAKDVGPDRSGRICNLLAKGE